MTGKKGSFVVLYDTPLSGTADQQFGCGVCVCVSNSNYEGRYLLSPLFETEYLVILVLPTSD